MNIEELYQLYLKHPKVSTDTRVIEEGTLFFALKGENFDGNKFAKNALEKGAAYAVISDSDYKEDERYILVEDTLKTLQELAQHHRKQLTIPVVGITGSNGKTTTKELMKSVLTEKFETFATHGNLNNHIGVPLSLLSIHSNHQIAIIEMGANHQKEIEFLANICQPDCGLITNIGKAHLEGFGGIEGVEKGKVELFTNLNTRGKQIFINVDDKRLKKYATTNTITYGSENANYTVRLESTTPFLSCSVNYNNEEVTLNSHLIGTYNLNNILTAVVIGDYFGLTPSEIKKGIENYIPTNNRSQLVNQGSNKLILDAYNANPSSMKEAITNLVKTNASTKYFVLGDMLELGDESEDEHTGIISLLEENELKGILVGKEFSAIQQENYPTFDSNLEAMEFLKNNPITNALILIKGSRGIKLETIQEVL